MGLLYDYFRAPSDEAAAAAIDDIGGPDSNFETLPETGIPPLTLLGTLESLLTNRTGDEIAADPRYLNVVAARDGGERLVLTLTDSLTAALADATDDRLAEVAWPWSQAEEFWGRGDPVALAWSLRDLATLARRANEAGDGLYCWLCV